jgi:PASTA domain
MLAAEIPRREVDWVLLAVSEDRRTLVIEYYWGGEFRNEPTVLLRESRAEVQIGVSLPDLTQDPATTAIAAFAAAGRVEVQLAEPINGRRVTGPCRAFADGTRYAAAYRTIPDGDSSMVAVPPVVGLCPDDAKWVLRAQGFEPTLAGRGRLICSQDPTAGQVPPDQDGPDRGAVTVTAGE